MLLFVTFNPLAWVNGWQDYGDGTCIPNKRPLGSLHDNLSREDCKNKCALFGKCRAIEWTDKARCEYRSWVDNEIHTRNCNKCNFYYEMEFRKEDDYSGCNNWYYSVIEPDEIISADCILSDVNYNGYDLGNGCLEENLEANSKEECRQECEKEQNCEFWTWIEDGGDTWTEDGSYNKKCCLKSKGAGNPENIRDVTGLYSGPKRC